MVMRSGWKGILEVVVERGDTEEEGRKFGEMVF